nr:hypothetical protein Q903MT_gene1838 [Picea sitchensis]
MRTSDYVPLRGKNRAASPPRLLVRLIQRLVQHHRKAQFSLYGMVIHERNNIIRVGDSSCSTFQSRVEVEVSHRSVKEPEMSERLLVCTKGRAEGAFLVPPGNQAQAIWCSFSLLY